jgi:hypothetical protein
VEFFARFVEVTHKVGNPAVELKSDFPAAGPLIGHRDGKAAREECRLPEALGQGVKVKDRVFHDVGVRHERDGRAGPLRGANLLNWTIGDAPLVALAPDVAVATDLSFKPFGQGVDDADTNAVKATRDLVALATKLSAGVEDRQDDFKRASPSLVSHRGDRNAGAIVGDGAGTVRKEGDVNATASPRHRLVNGVVDKLVDEVVKPPRAGGPDVHAGSVTDRFETLEDCDVLGVIAIRRVGVVGFGIAHSSCRSRLQMSRQPDVESLSTPAGVPGLICPFSEHKCCGNRPLEGTSEFLVGDALDRMVCKCQVSPPGLRDYRRPGLLWGRVKGSIGDGEPQPLKGYVRNGLGERPAERFGVCPKLLGPTSI